MLKETIEHIEEELSECKKFIDFIENESNEERKYLGEPNRILNQKNNIERSKDLTTIVNAIEEEFKTDTSDSLSWLVSKASQLKREEIIIILRDGGIVLPKNLAKKQISGVVKQILTNRYSNTRLFLLQKD